MNSNNHNPGIVPGYYNPQQSKTEALDYQAFLGGDFVDPTQVPMIPGDTQRPMQSLQSPQRQEQADTRVMPPMPENYQKEMQRLYTEREVETKIIYNQTIETIVIPIRIKLTIDLDINHGNNT